MGEENLAGKYHRSCNGPGLNSVLPPGEKVSRTGVDALLKDPRLITFNQGILNRPPKEFGKQHAPLVVRGCPSREGIECCLCEARESLSKPWTIKDLVA